MDKISRLAKAIRGRAPRPQFVYGVWAGAETVDPNLSLVTIPGGDFDGSDLTLRFVPKAEHVTGLDTASTVLCLGNPLCIIAKVVGNISLASIEGAP